MIRLTLCLILTQGIPALPLPAHAEERAHLEQQILAMDKRLFDAFNQRDLEATGDIFDPDIEFYHDTGGLSRYEQAMENSRRLFANAGDLTRVLLHDSLEIHPIAGYGALQTGQHRFCHTENGQMDCGTFKFMHIWRHHNGRWTLSRVVSYGH
ncbi:MAG: nuclear transport factor 2 family protein [Xanthomonadales bacterium]|nr:nuclear transport factor 2 family protein [Xanthomonadales bacterium]